ncbi:MAG TPA: hypothetical protein VGE04_16045 [Chloroflexia bacterium]
MRQHFTTRHGEPHLHSTNQGGLVRRAVPLLRVTLLIALCAALAGGNRPGVSHAQQGESHAGLVVQFGDDTTNTYCLPFTDESITGLDLLLKTGLDVTAETQGALGGLICRIGPDGCNFPEQACVCQSYGPNGKYWVYNHLKGGVWKASSQGASSYKVRDGEVDGWAWSSGKGPSVTPSFAELCAAVLPATPGPTATNPPPPAPTSTPIPPRPTDTAVIQPPTRTPLPPAPTATPKPQLTPTPAPALPTKQAPQPLAPTSTPEPPAPTENPTTLPTNTPTGTPTSQPTTTTPTAMPTATATATAAPTSIPTPTVIVQAAGATAQSFAQVVALGIGVAVVGGLALWFGLRRRRL